MYIRSVDEPAEITLFWFQVHGTNKITLVEIDPSNHTCNINLVAIT